MTIDLVLQPRDGLTLKDPRGFATGGGVTALGLPWPGPETMAGAVRAMVGRAQGLREDYGEDEERWAALREAVGMRGPVMLASPLDRGDWAPLWPTPEDAVRLPHPRAGQTSAPSAQIHWLAPRRREGGCQVRGRWSGAEAEVAATEALWWPLPPAETKPLPPRQLWTHEETVTWLLGPRLRDEEPAGVRRSPTERRDIHLAVDQETLAARDEHLFIHPTNEPLRRDGRTLWEFGIGLRVSGPVAANELADRPWRIGGEGRFATAHTLPDTVLATDQRLIQAWGKQGQRMLRLLLVTPAQFAAGWRPDWLKPKMRDGQACFEGELPGLKRPVVLRGACLGRSLWTSGWDLAKRRPKPSVACVSAGTVYFLESLAEPFTADDAKTLWLSSIQQPEAQAARNGFGLVLPGLWPAI